MKTIQIRRVPDPSQSPERKIPFSASLPESVYEKFEELRRLANYKHVSRFYGDILLLVADHVEVIDDQGIAIEIESEKE